MDKRPAGAGALAGRRGRDRAGQLCGQRLARPADRKSTRLNSSHLVISYAVFCLKKKKVFSPEGALLRSMRVEAPLSVAVLPEGEVAVATLRGPLLGIVVRKEGGGVRAVGDSEKTPGRGGFDRFFHNWPVVAGGPGYVY